MTRLTATYEITATSLDEAAQRAAAVALEQSIEMPPAAVQQPFILEDVLGKVLDVRLTGENRYTARVGLALSTVLSANGPQPMQFINMLFGNSSLHEWVRCVDVELPDALLRTFTGPRFGGTVGAAVTRDESGRSCRARDPVVRLRGRRAHHHLVGWKRWQRIPD